MHTFAQELAALWRGRSLALMLARRDIATRHAAAAGGGVWAYVQPLLMVAAYYLLFDVVFAMRVGDGPSRTRAAGQFLIVGSLPWMAFCDALSRGMNSLIDAGSLLQKNALPAVLFPVRAVMASTIVFGPLILLVALAYFPIHHFALPVLSLLPLLALQLVLCCVLGYLLAVLAAALRDTLQIVTFLLSVGIFVSPVLFPMSMFPQNWRWVLWINPMTPVVSGYQAVLLQGQWPSAATWVALLLWIVGSAVVLDAVVRRSRDVLVDWL
jgi:lipopolysaccharide transport system permease protein